jgi:hypothetical protein
VQVWKVFELPLVQRWSPSWHWVMHWPGVTPATALPPVASHMPVPQGVPVAARCPSFPHARNPAASQDPAAPDAQIGSPQTTLEKSSGFVMQSCAALAAFGLQAVSAPHLPSFPQVCIESRSPLQRMAPGVQSPAQAAL